MGSITNPNKAAKRQAREQERVLQRQQQKQKAELAEAEALKVAKIATATSPTKGRRSLISPNSGMRETLG